MTERSVQLFGRLFLDFDIYLITGLHIGGSPGTLAIGNVDNPVIRNPLNNQPYIPGSSLRGKMRSQFEKYMAGKQNTSIGRDVCIHTCKDAGEYATCPICKTFGIPGENKHSETSRLIVRDAFLTQTSAEQLNHLRLDLPYTEVKWEAAIDRVTSAATPRQQERVPAGAIFRAALTFSLYEDRDTQYFNHVLQALRLVEEDYLGGQGARGSGQVALHNLVLKERRMVDSRTLTTLGEADSLDALIDAWETRSGSGR